MASWRYEWNERAKKFVVYEGDEERRYLKSEKEAAAIVRKMNSTGRPGGDGSMNM